MHKPFIVRSLTKLSQLVLMDELQGSFLFCFGRIAMKFLRRRGSMAWGLGRDLKRGEVEREVAVLIPKLLVFIENDYITSLLHGFYWLIGRFMEPKRSTATRN